MFWPPLDAINGCDEVKWNVILKRSTAKFALRFALHDGMINFIAHRVNKRLKTALTQASLIAIS